MSTVTPMHTSRNSLLIIAACVMWNILYVVSVRNYVNAAFNPNPAGQVNKTEARWDTFQISIFFMGIATTFVNMLAMVTIGEVVEEIDFDFPRQRELTPEEFWSRSKKKSSSISKTLSINWDKVFTCLSVVFTFTLVLVTVFGPFLLPFIMYPAAQKQGWNHRCDPYPVEVVLEGEWKHSPKTQPSIASFYYWQNGARTKFFEYAMSHGETRDKLGLNLRRIVNDDIPEHSYPFLQQVSYDFFNSTVSGTCMTRGGTTATPCLTGTFDLGEILSFSLTETREIGVSTVYNLRAVDPHWKFSHQAPSAMLRRVDPSNGMFGDIALMTAVTAPGHRNRLKVCLARESGVDMIVPLGMLLLKLDEYGAFGRISPFSIFTEGLD